MGQMKVYALKADLEARGMADRVLEGVNLVDYGGFVDLVTEHTTCQSWL
jgi:tRNA 2-thiouridine synthesizing protein B